MDLTRCGHCGANFEPGDLAQPACRYCSTVLPHHARAVEQAEIVTQLLADKDRDGVPDALEDLVAAHVAAATKAAPPQAHIVVELGEPSFEEPAVQEAMAIARATDKRSLTGFQIASLLFVGLMTIFVLYVFWPLVRIFGGIFWGILGVLWDLETGSILERK